MRVKALSLFAIKQQLARSVVINPDIFKVKNAQFVTHFSRLKRVCGLSDGIKKRRY